MRRKLPLALAVVVLAACSTVQTSGEPSSAGTTAEAAPADRERTVTVMLDWTPNTNHSGLYLAEANGWYADAGLNVEMIQPGEQGGLTALASGDAHFAISVQEELTPARAQGAPVVSIAAILASNTSSLIARADEGITRPRDLAGRRYGGFGGELETELIGRLVECDGGDPSTVEFVEVGNVDYRAGLERDFFDFVWIFEGWDGIRLRQAGMDVVTLPFSDYFDCIPDWYTPLLATSEQMIEDSPDVVTEFMDATTRGYLAAIDDPQAAADALLDAAPELDEQLVRESADYLAEHYKADDLPWGTQRDEIWQEYTDFLRQAGIVEGEFAVTDAYTNAFLPGTPAQTAPSEAMPSAAATQATTEAATHAATEAATP